MGAPPEGAEPTWGFTLNLKKNWFLEEKFSPSWGYFGGFPIKNNIFETPGLIEWALEPPWAHVGVHPESKKRLIFEKKVQTKLGLFCGVFSGNFNFKALGPIWASSGVVGGGRSPHGGSPCISKKSIFRRKFQSELRLFGGEFAIKNNIFETPGVQTHRVGRGAP